jgi:hypothetical protein
MLWRKEKSHLLQRIETRFLSREANSTVVSAMYTTRKPYSECYEDPKSKMRARVCVCVCVFVCVRAGSCNALSDTFFIYMERTSYLGRTCLQTCISHTQHRVDGFQQDNLLYISVNSKPQITFFLNTGQQC